MLTSEKKSAADKYFDIAVGDRRISSILRYELSAWILAPMPGALGYFLRGKLYPGMLGHAGRGLIFGRSISIRNPKRIYIGDGTILDDFCVLDAKGTSDEKIEIGSHAIIGRNTTVSCKGGRMEIGDNSNISANCMLITESELSIGKNVLIAGMTYIVAGGNHVIDRIDVPIIQQPMEHKGGVHIEDNCWIGAHTTILDGVKIGRDTIVAAGAVVTKSLPEFSIAAGVPAKVVKFRK